MRSRIAYALLIFMLCCKDRKTAKVVPAPISIPAKDSTLVHRPSPDSSTASTVASTPTFVERASLDLPGYSVSAVSKFDFEGQTHPTEDDSYYFKGDYLIVIDKHTKKGDTIKLGTGNSDGDQVRIIDVTGKLKMRRLMLEVVTPGNSDWYSSEFIGYEADSLKNLFSIDDFGRGVTLRRKDSVTLAGTIEERDKIVEAFEKYPVVVSLKDFEVSYPKLDTLYIGYRTEATSDFQAIRISRDSRNGSPVQIKAGRRLRVDTFYQSAGIVTLSISDSIKVKVNVDSATEHIRGNAAG